MDIIISLFTPYPKMVVIIKKGENVNVYHAGFNDAKKFYLMSTDWIKSTHKIKKI